MNGLNTQWHNTATWIRYNCSSILHVSGSDLLKPDIRNTEFHEEIGWMSKTGLYSSVDVPILHKDWNGEHSLSSIFLNPKLMGVSFIHPTSSLWKLIFSLRSTLPLFMVPVLQRVSWGTDHFNRRLRWWQRLIKSMTLWLALLLHAVCWYTATCIDASTLLNSLSQAHWVLSADDTLQEVGLSTGIHYFNDFEKYSTILEASLQQKETSILNIFKQWSERIFPIESRRLQKAIYLLLADSDDEIEYQDGNGRARSHSITSLNPVVM